MNPELPHFSEDLNLIDGVVLTLLRELLIKYTPNQSKEKVNNSRLANIAEEIYQGKTGNTISKKIRRNSTPENLSDYAFKQAIDYYLKYSVFEKYHDFFFIIELLELDQLSSQSDNPNVVQLRKKFDEWRKGKSGKDLPNDIYQLLLKAEKRWVERQESDFEKIIELIYRCELTETSSDPDIKRLCYKFRNWRNGETGKKLPAEIKKGLMKAAKFYDSTKWTRREKPTKTEP